ncbi:hypothetical protein [Rhizobium rhizogenes]|uniref:Uncharacterized protein n=1 Tax=Rhizobium rhizogenes TaxID=359 RepID=A0AA92C4R0_RHIRH|nr:hypothetical protein [Rhizobium rhizogenes]PVE55375.1 hypothetical protein DC430_09285 [Rhizobium rhizogenes]PVE65703.1 hypothetical protein DC415_12205 [Agrobacterium tumefaciens]PVE75767.1 hypothetical protein DCP16_12205 [Sphingomonas sp. TPD3009]
MTSFPATEFFRDCPWATTENVRFKSLRFTPRLDAEFLERRLCRLELPVNQRPDRLEFHFLDELDRGTYDGALYKVSCVSPGDQEEVPTGPAFLMVSSDPRDGLLAVSVIAERRSAQVSVRPTVIDDPSYS